MTGASQILGARPARREQLLNDFQAIAVAENSARRLLTCYCLRDHPMSMSRACFMFVFAFAFAAGGCRSTSALQKSSNGSVASGSPDNATNENAGGTNGDSAAPIAADSNVVAPLANAGPDQAVIRGSLVKLDGRRSFHPLGLDYDLRWSQVSGESAVTLSNADREVTSFVAPAITDTLTFRLVANGTLGGETADEVTIKVVEQDPYSAPTLITSGDISVVPFRQVLLRAFLIDGASLDGSVTWRRIGGPFSGTIGNNFGRDLTVVAPESGYLFYSVDGASQGLTSAPAFVVVAVDANATEVDVSPTANGPSALARDTWAPGEIVTLVAPRQSKASVWTQLTGEPVTFIEKASSGWRFLAPSTPQALMFSFVEDGTALRKVPLLLTVSVEDPSLDGVVPDAGADQIAHPGTTVSLDARASVVGSSTTYHWQQSAGLPVTLANEDAATTTFTAPMQTTDLVFLLTLGGLNGVTRPDSIVVKVRPTSENTAPTGQLTKAQTGGQTFTVTAAIHDPENDPVTCNWSTTSGTASALPTTGMTTTVTVNSASATVQAHCCDSLSLCIDRTATLP